MPAIRNTTLLKKFTDFFQLKTNDFLDSEAGRMLVPVITHPILPQIVMLRPTQTQLANGDVVVPAGKKWKILNIHVSWTSDVTAGNREILLEITETGGGDIFRGMSRNFQAASLSVVYEFFEGASHTGSANGLVQNIPIPEGMIFTENTLFFLFDNAGIGVDSVGEAVFLIEEQDMLDDELEIRAVT